MRGSIIIGIAVLLLGPGVVVSADETSSIEAFVGGWTGQDVSSNGDALTPDALSLDIRKEADGFRVAWRDLGTDEPGAETIDARFSATDRPGVYEYVSESGSLLTRMFASPETGNPLKGETMLWARLDDTTLAVYSMKIDLAGGFDLDHYSWTRNDDRLTLIFNKRTEDDAAEIKLEGELAAKGE